LGLSEDCLFSVLFKKQFNWWQAYC